MPKLNKNSEIIQTLSVFCAGQEIKDRLKRKVNFPPIPNRLVAGAKNRKKDSVSVFKHPNRKFAISNDLSGNASTH